MRGKKIVVGASRSLFSSKGAFGAPTPLTHQN